MSLDIRMRDTGEVLPKRQWKNQNPHISTPKAWTQAVYDMVGADPVIAVGPSSENSSELKEWIRDGVEQNADGQWVYKWIEADIYRNAESAEVKASLEQDHMDRLERSTAQWARNFRNKLLQMSDWTQMTDSPLSNDDKTAWATYRQQLRDAPTSIEAWPNMQDSDWPTKP